MTDVNAPLTVPASEPTNAVATPLFYVVSLRKFSILFIATLGLYYIYWFYKNWDRVKDGSPYATAFRDTIWPFPRAIFAVFFVHALFRKIKEQGADILQVRAWGNTAHATGLVALLLVFNALDRLVGKNIGAPWTDLLSVLILAPMLPVFRAAQEIINVTCGDPDGATNSKLTAANYAWIVVGCIFWCLFLLAQLLPPPGS